VRPQPERSEDDMWRVRTSFTGVTGSPWVNTAFFSDTATLAQDCVDAVGTFWNSVDALMEASVVWTTLVDVEQVVPTTGNVVAVEATTPVAGAGAGATTGLPTLTQGLVRWRTGDYIGGREVRGRWFIPGLATTANNDGNLAATATTTINNAAAALLADPDAVLVIWSRKNLSEHPVSSGSVWNQFAGLRSRRD
jgi:hypothetical protein